MDIEFIGYVVKIGNCYLKDRLNLNYTICTRFVDAKKITKLDYAKKVAEELGEISAGVNKNDKKKIEDSLGDILVTLIILSKDLDVDLLDCLRGAYDVIKDRTGKTVNGVFVKEEDLHE